MFVVHFCDIDLVEDVWLFNLLLFTVVDETVPCFEGEFVYIH
jgi:hypothetical protein